MAWIADLIFGSVLNEITKAAIILVLMAFIANQFYLIYRMSLNTEQKKVDEESIKVQLKKWGTMWFNSPNFLVLVSLSILSYLLFYAAWISNSREYYIFGTIFILFGLFYFSLVNHVYFLKQKMEKVQKG